MQIPDNKIQEFKKLVKEHSGKELTDAEAYESANNLINFCRLLMEIEMRDLKRKEKLKQFPKGFCFDDDGIYNCPICYTQMKNEGVWYDDCGQKCLDCQDNLNKKRIPKMVFKNTDSWFSFLDLKYDFGIDKKEANKLIKDGKLISRDLINRNGRCYFSIFMIKDNPWLSKLEKK